MRPIFNEKVAKKWNLWVYKQYIMHCLRLKSQHLQLLFIKQYMNSNRVLPKRVKKKKKRKTQTGETQTCIQTNAKCWSLSQAKYLLLLMIYHVNSCNTNCVILHCLKIFTVSRVLLF